MALFGVWDTVREDSVRVVKWSMEMVKTSVMPTGDSLEHAIYVSTSVGIVDDEVTALQLPEEKECAVEDALSRGTEGYKCCRNGSVLPTALGS